MKRLVRKLAKTFSRAVRTVHVPHNALRFLNRHRLLVGLLGGVLITLAVVVVPPHLSELPSLFTHTYPEVRELSTVHWRFQQYQDYFQKLAERKGGVYAFEVLARAPFPVGTDLHLLGHVVGTMLYKEKGIDAIKFCTPEFRNACSHSVVIGILNDHGEGSLKDMSAMCKQAPGGKGAYTMCFHGLGHGVLAYTGYDLKRAVAMCKEVGTPEYKNREYVECVGGAVMEMIAGVHDRTAWEKQVGNYFKDSDPLYPCDAAFMPDDVRGICYVQLTPHLFTAAGGSLGKIDPAVFPKAFSFCNAIPVAHQDLRSACYGGFGKEFVVIAQGRDVRHIGSTNEASLRKIRDWCSEAHDAAGERACNGTALSSLYWGGENEPQAAFTFCSIATGDAGAACYDQLSFQVSYYGTTEKETQRRCALLPEAYRSSCTTPSTSH